MELKIDFDGFKDRPEREQRRIVNFCFRTLGTPIEDLVRATGLDWGAIERLAHPEVKTTSIVLHPEQTKCPACAGPVLTTPMTFSMKHDLNDVRRSHTYCCMCLKPLLLYFNKEGLLSVTEVPFAQCLSSEYEDGLHRMTGVSFTTHLYGRQLPTMEVYQHGQGEGLAQGWEARIGVALFGSVNFKSMLWSCPFDPHYHDNYCSGQGATIKDAVDILKSDIEKLTDSLFAE